MYNTRVSGKDFMAVGLALFLLFGGIDSSYGSTHGEEADTPHYLVCRQDRLTLKTDMTPLVQLVEEIAAAAGIEIITASTMYSDQFVAADIQDGSVEKIIQALLDGYNYLIFFSTEAPRQGLHLLSGTMPAPVGEKLLVLTANGDRYQLVKGNPPSGVKGKTDGMNATKIPGLPDGVSTPSAHSLNDRGNSSPENHAQRNLAGLVRENLFLPLKKHENKEEKMTMHTRETSYSEAAPAEKNVSSLPGTENSLTEADDEEGMAEYGDAAALRESFADDFDNDTEETAVDQFVREDYLRYQIDKLATRIESGYSDRLFELWSQHRDSKYVTNDRDLLVQYEKELRTLEDKN